MNMTFFKVLATPVGSLEFEHLVPAKARPAAQMTKETPRGLVRKPSVNAIMLAMALSNVDGDSTVALSSFNTYNDKPDRKQAKVAEFLTVCALIAFRSESPPAAFQES